MRPKVQTRRIRDFMLDPFAEIVCNVTTDRGGNGSIATAADRHSIGVNRRRARAEESAKDFHPMGEEHVAHRRGKGVPRSGLAGFLKLFTHVLEKRRWRWELHSVADRSGNEVTSGAGLRFGASDDFRRSERAADSLQLRLDRTVELLTGGREKTGRESDAVAERRLKHFTFGQQELARNMHEEAVYIRNSQGLNMTDHLIVLFFLGR